MWPRSGPDRLGGMARSVAELLPRPFADLTLEDVAGIITATSGEERETLWFERKASVTPNSLSKACAAFANTYGGLLVVGVADDDDALVGIDPLAGEAQLWVKDALRGLVLPMPPFRARWLPLDGTRGVLLVLVEESSTTPHLLLRSGAIYVRNPGSSDPVPIHDQRRLLDLTARGERAVERARLSASALLEIPLTTSDGFLFADWEPVETLVIAPTGVGAEFEDRLFNDPRTPDKLSRAMWGPLPDTQGREQDSRWAMWAQHYAGVRRSFRTPVSGRYRSIEEAVAVTREGAVKVARGYVPQSDDPVWIGSLLDEELREHFREAQRGAREILAEYGTHGDLHVVYQLDARDRGITFQALGAARLELDDPVTISFDSTFDDDGVEGRIFAELLRAVGQGPR